MARTTAHSSVQVLLQPFARIVTVESGAPLLEVLRAAGIPIETICGGKGECRKCRVILESGSCSPLAAEDPTRGLTPEEVNRGYVLACRVRVECDCEITIPVESRIDSPQILQAAVLRPGTLAPAVRQYTVLAAPAGFLPFEMPSLQLAGYDGPRPTLHRDLHARITSAREAVATVRLAGGLPEVIDVSEKEATRSPYGLAIDLGTTTIVCLLVNLNNGEVIGGGSTMNRQITYGEEVITRIAYTAKKDGLPSLQSAARESINEIIDRLTEEAGIPASAIQDCCVGANTVMNHLLIGKDPMYLELANTRVSRTPLTGKAADVGLHACDKAYLYCLPNVSRFLGGDAVGDVLISGMHRSPELSLLIDLGTNGEIILGNQEWLASVTCASGPAFEGGGILHGMRGMRGAIDHVIIDPRLGTAICSVIGGTAPRGICGSGIVDALAGMVAAGILDFTGKLIPGASGVREGPFGLEYVLVPAEETQIGREILLTQKDVDYCMDSKAAVCGGASVLLKKYRVPPDAIQRVYLAGAFGTYVNPRTLLEFGILPHLSSAKFHPIGNGSLSGAFMTLLSLEARNEAEKIAERMVYIDLLTDLDFIEEYTQALYIPGTRGNTKSRTL